jgi:predicted  nucleic acid-binding Zn-ribbon protein
LDIARDAAEAARTHGEQNSRGAEEETQHWQQRCEALEDALRRVEQEKADLEDSGGRGSNQAVSCPLRGELFVLTGQHDGAIPELKAEIHSLVDELNSLSTRNDELMSQREQDAEGMDEMEAKVQEYKKKYDAIRIELRNLKGELAWCSRVQ